MPRWPWCLAILVTTSLAGCAGMQPAAPPAGVELVVAADIAERLAQYADAELTAELDRLPASERQALAHLLSASLLMDEVFLRQAWPENPELARQLAEWSDPAGEAVRAYFEINYGPWDRLAEREPFLGTTQRPPGAGYYPVDLTREELEEWLARHPEDEEAFRSLATVIRRWDGRLVAVPYSREYRPWLTAAAEELRAAAAATADPTLERFLELRADAFLSDDYFDSDLAWMDLDSAVEVTIGPYETYEDDLFGYKAAFQSFLTVDIPEESHKLSGYKAELPWLESNLPIPDEHKNPDRGAESPIRVVDLVFSAGDTRAGVQTIAFNLPNDERVRQVKGSKKVLLRNVIAAKFEQILRPIAAQVLAPEQVGQVSGQAFFDQVLHHELAHGLGPGVIRVDGRQTEVRLELRELYSVVEEAKADVMGVYNILALVDRGAMPAELLDSLLPTYLAGLFRSARFGVQAAHGQGVVAQFNYLQEREALSVDAHGRYRVEPERFPGAIGELLHDLLMLQATGDYSATAAFLERYGQPTPELLAAIERLADVPVDIRPRYPQAAELASP